MLQSVITHVKNKESNMQLLRIYLPVKLVDGRMPIKKGKNLFVPNLQYCQFEQDSWKKIR